MQDLMRQGKTFSIIGVAVARILSTMLAGFVLAAGTSRADVIDNAAHQYQVNADVLRAIAYYESHLNPHAYHRNLNGTVDIGLMQINSIHLAGLRARMIDANMLIDPQLNANVGASLLRESIDKFGSSWRAVGAYHSHREALSAQYARTVYDIYLAQPWTYAVQGARSSGKEAGVIVRNIDVN
ncbi:BapC protein [Paraburkholderia ribeironis]|uniref:BapC protein n=1 Tax=Paraburkholderia ribeironis TaxID=1247936 RepID=A0A1N7SC28_9BURK|nr:lytic transglycosylase domain-containing protein [Paraburkholderia ribeironis]SIT44958.1 BapC protein [Paraburkholderia ribeironis]